MPEEWQLAWAGPPAPDVYIRELCYRAHAALKRLDHCQADKDYFPTGYCLFYIYPCGDPLSVA